MADGLGGVMEDRLEEFIFGTRLYKREDKILLGSAGLLPRDNSGGRVVGNLGGDLQDGRHRWESKVSKHDFHR